MTDETPRTDHQQRMMLIETLGIFALKTLLTLNSGATIVLLALLGNLQGGKGSISVDLTQLQQSMMLFFFGISFVLVAVAITYVIAQLQVARGEDAAGVLSPFWHMVAMLLPAIISFLFFAWGFHSATYAFS